MTAVSTDRGVSGPNLIGNLVTGEMGVELRIIRVHDVRYTMRRPKGPWHLPNRTLVLLSPYRDNFLRLRELRLQCADVLVDLLVFNNEPVDLGERRVTIRDAPQRDHELEQVGVRLLPERLLRLAEQ